MIVSRPAMRKMRPAPRADRRLPLLILLICLSAGSAQLGASARQELISLHFEDVEVRQALQHIARLQGLNMVLNDTVQGTISLSLSDIPWEQALEIILGSRGLGMRRRGDVIVVASTAELARQRQAEIEAERMVEEMTPLITRVIQIRHARADDIAELLLGDKGRLLSGQGSLQVDHRTNALLARDTPANLTRLGQLVDMLDVPVRQVSIETRIVIAGDDFARELGVRFGISGRGSRASTGIGVSGSLPGAIQEREATGSADLSDRLNVNLPASSSSATSIGLSILRPDVLLDLELSALQAEGRGEIISTPRVITANGQTAVIRQGERIPYEESAESGNTTITFIDAVLATRVTPRITADGGIILDIKVNKDNPGTREIAGTPSIETRELETQVYVRDGETVVLGGIYEIAGTEQLRKTPLLGDLPGIGRLFRYQGRSETKAELLVFVTPRLIDTPGDIP